MAGRVFLGMKKVHILFLVLVLAVWIPVYGAGIRIVSIAPATTEILFALGADEEIVGVTTFCNYPPGALNKAKIGSFSDPDIEKIVSLKPDIIFATGLEQALVVERLRQLKLNVFVSDPSDIQELLGSIKQIGKLIHRDAQAEALVDRMKAGIEQVREKVRLIPADVRPKVFVEIWDDPLLTAGKGSFVDELIENAGGINIARDVSKAYTYFSPEQVIKRNPDCIIFGHNSNDDIKDVIKKRLGWSEIAAVKKGRLYNDINPDIFLRPGPRLVEGLKEIHKKLYPQ